MRATLFKKVLLPFFLLTLFTVYQASISMFTHVHYVNGVMITHSHPFDGKHKHTKSELLVIDRLSHAVTLENHITYDFKPFFRVLFSLEQERLLAHVSQSFFQIPSFRAPPFCVL